MTHVRNNNNNARFSPDKTECEETYFKCKNSRCIPGRWRCDYDNDCRDGSDEENCSWRNCTESEFKCRNGRCILQQAKCDGHNQCTDGSDELNCPSYECNATEFRCVKSGYCIPSAWQCDGDVDCTDESDELHCNDICKLLLLFVFSCSVLIELLNCIVCPRCSMVFSVVNKVDRIQLCRSMCCQGELAINDHVASSQMQRGNHY